MPKFPEPPGVDALRNIAPEIRTLAAGTPLARIYYTAGAYPTAWNEFRFLGPLDARWDHHDRARNAPWLTVFASVQPLQLLDLSGAFPTRAGASMAINSASHARARRWARAFYLAYEDLHGIYYCSSMHANAPAIALNERSVKLGTMPKYPLFN